MLTATVVLVAALVALAPWWRNHAYVRDFYDYGLVISGVGRIAEGERPYVDFVTPIQSLLLLGNLAAEKLGGGTFQGMTLGGAGLIVLLAAGGTWWLGRRWSLGGAAVVSVAIAAGSAAQHTILWHNTLGVACLLTATWGAANLAGAREMSARRRWAGVAVVAIALWAGGMNKLNFHLVALAMVLGWTVRAAVAGNVRPLMAFGLGGLWLLAGVVAPVLAEMAWTGASFEQWRYNVIELPFAHRSGELRKLLGVGFYLRTPHEYYGTAILPQAGLLGALLAVIAGIAAWRGGNLRGWFDRLLVVGAVLLAAGAGAALLATNFEISHIALAAALVLAVSLWIGFGVPARGGWFWAGLVLPALIAGGGAWWSAWLGQRSQFGHSPAPRSAYLPLETAAPAFAYMRGTRIPPEMHQSLGLAAQWLPAPEADGRRRVFYGPGIEWLDRILPAQHHGGLPLWMHHGTSFGPAEEHRLAQLVGREGVFLNLLSPVAWAHWPTQINFEVVRYYDADLLGPVIKRWVRVDRMRPAFRNAIEFINLFGGNARSTELGSTEEPLSPQRAVDGRLFMGVTHGHGTLTLFASTLRIDGEVILRRAEGASGDVAVEFMAGQRSSQGTHPRWRQRVELPADRAEVAVPFTMDAGGAQVDFHVTVPPEFAGQVVAGYRGPRITHIGTAPGPAPRLRPNTPDDDPADPAAVAALLPGGWPPAEVVVRRGRATPDGLELATGGEVWVRADGWIAEFSGEIRVPAQRIIGMGPAFRVVWAKASRVEIVEQGNIGEGQRRDFRMWSAEPDAWFGLINEEAEGGTAIIVKVNRVQPAP